jgi:hypothetical protein
VQEAVLAELGEADREPGLVPGEEKRGRGADEVKQECKVGGVDGVTAGAEEGYDV